MQIEAFEALAKIERIYHKVPVNMELYIKRDDAIDPLISGNKWWKLKHSFLDARSKNKKLLVSFGGAYSNHLIALSASAAKFGMKSFAFIRSDEGIPQNICTSICTSMGMELQAVSRNDYKNKPALFEKYFAQNSDAYYIDEGGRSTLGALGMQENMSMLQETYDHIFLAAGTGCSTAGVLNYVLEKNLHTIVHAVVVHNGLEEVKADVEALTHRPTNQIQFHTTQQFGRYGKHTTELVNFCKDFQQGTGVMLDLVYTAKAMYVLYEQMAELENSKILFLHTGGLWGNVGKADAFFSESL